MPGHVPLQRSSNYSMKIICNMRGIIPPYCSLKDQFWVHVYILFTWQTLFAAAYFLLFHVRSTFYGRARNKVHSYALYLHSQVHKITSKNHGCVWYDTIQCNSMPVSFSRNTLNRFMLSHTPSCGSSPAVWSATSEQKYCNSCWVGQSPPSLPTQIHPTVPQILSSTTTLICVVIIQAKDRG